MSNAILLKGVTKKYRIYEKKSHILYEFLPQWISFLFHNNSGKDIWVLRNLNLAIRKGERLGIIGENGTGKSTLLKLICGYIQPTGGKIMVYGKAHSLLSLGAGFLPNLDAYKNIETYFAFNNVPLTQENIQSIIEFSELEDYALQPLKTYSSGMFARFAFAVMTEIKPQILIIDEILGAGDAYFLGKCVERLKHFTAKEDMTLIFVSHDLSSVQHICSRVVWLHKGIIAGDGSPLETIKMYQSYIREKENLHLLERQTKIPKSVGSTIHNDHHFIFRFIVSESAIKNPKPDIYEINFEGRKYKTNLRIGAPLDNDSRQEISILDVPGKTDWGAVKEDKYGTYRRGFNATSLYRHAPIRVIVSPFIQEINSDEKFSVCVKYRSDVDLLFQIYNSHKNVYETITLLKGTHHEISQEKTFFSLPKRDNSSEKTKEPHQEKDHLSSKHTSPHSVKDKIDGKVENSSYGSKEIYIESVDIVDEEENTTRILFSGNSYKIRIKYFTGIKIYNPVFVFCIYTSEGICVTQFMTSSSEIGVDYIDCPGYIDINISSLSLGSKECVASAAIFKKYEGNKREPEAYHVLDRCIFLKIEDPFLIYERGLCHQPYTAQIYQHEF